MRPHENPACMEKWRLSAAMACALLLASCAQPLQAPSSPPAVVFGQNPALRVAIEAAEAAARRPPQAMARIRTEGRLPTDPVARASSAAKTDWYSMLMLALAAQQDQAAGYGPVLERYFAAWVAVFEPQFNPISESQFHWLAMAYEFGSTHLSPATEARTVALFHSMATGYLSPPRTAVSMLRNNWQSHRVKLAATLAYAINDTTLIARSRDAFQKQLSDNIAADGMVRDFQERDALHYVTYSLEPLLIAALVAARHGDDWYSLQGSNGATLEQALKWLAPYADGEKTHAEFRRTSIAFDRSRAAAGVPGYSGLWNPQEALPCYQIAARLRSGWIPLAVRLGPAPSWLELGFASPAISAAQAEKLLGPPSY